MACPLFLPQAPLTGFSDVYQGACAAQSDSPIAADLLESCCNNGYGRASCARAAQSDSDVYRFMIKAHKNGIVDVAWSSERNHHPVAVGTLAISPQSTAQSPLEHQARVYVTEFLKQTRLP